MLKERFDSPWTIREKKNEEEDFTRVCVHCTQKERDGMGKVCKDEFCQRGSKWLTAQRHKACLVTGLTRCQNVHDQLVDDYAKALGKGKKKSDKADKDMALLEEQIQEQEARIRQLREAVIWLKVGEDLAE